MNPNLSLRWTLASVQQACLAAVQSAAESLDACAFAQAVNAAETAAEAYSFIGRLTVATDHEAETIA